MNSELEAYINQLTQDPEHIRGGFLNGDERCFYVQRVSRMSDGPEGRGYYPPEPGQRIVSYYGPFRVEEAKMVPGTRYFVAQGHLTSQEE